MEELLDMGFAISDRIAELQERGLLGREIAQILRDEYPIRSAQVALQDAGFHVEIEPFIDLKGLFVSDFPLMPGEEIPVYQAVRASTLLTVWLRDTRAPTSRNAYLN